MKRIIISVLVIGLSFVGNAYGADQWLKGKPAGTDSPATIDDTIQVNNNATDRLLADYREGCAVSYSSATTISVAAGQIACDNTARSLRKWRENTSATSVTFSNLDVGVEAEATYYVYAVSETDATTFTCVLSLSSSTPTGVSYYARLGSFSNDSDLDIDSDSVVDDAGLTVADGAISTAKLATNSVTNVKIVDATIDLTAKVTGTLPVGSGGTGVTATANAANGVAVCNASGYITDEFETYDSDWFAASASSTYAKTHSLGTTAVSWTLYASDSATGASNVFVLGDAYASYDNMQNHGSFITDVTTTTCNIRTSNRIAAVIGTHVPSGGDGWTSGYLRLIAVALD